MKNCCKGHGFDHAPKHDSKHQRISNDSAHQSCSSAHHTNGADGCQANNHDQGSSSSSDDDGESDEPPPSGVQRTRYHIEHMDCPTEEALIRKKISSLPGVVSLKFNLLQRILTVDHQCSPLVVQKALKELSMPGTILDDQNRLPQPVSQSMLSVRQKLILLFGGVAAFLSELLVWFGSWSDQSIPVILCALMSIFLVGIPILKKGWIALKHFTLNIYFLMALAVIGAGIIGQWPEAAMVIFLFALAETIEGLALFRAKKAIESLNALVPDQACVLRDGQWIALSPEDVSKGDFVRVRTGERIPLDGVMVSSGHAEVNQAPITGESVPVYKEKGDALFAGTIVSDGIVELEVSSLAKEGTLAKIASSIQEAQSQRAPTQRFVDRFSFFYTPAVVLIALFFVIWKLYVGSPWQEALYQSLVLLVIACPCALVISTPVTVVSGLARAARMGLLIKGGVFLEMGKKLNAIAFDKTGTLTQGNFVVTDIIHKIKDIDTLKYAASLNQHSTHPIAKSMVSSWSDHKNSDDMLLDVQDFSVKPGYGVSGIISGRRWYLGSERWLKDFDMAIPNDLMSKIREGSSISFLFSQEMGVVGLIALADQIKKDVPPALAQLNSLGIKTIMLTGDHQLVAQSIAQQANIHIIHSGLLPEEKQSIVKSYQNQGTIIGMVGDGINDAPALAQSNIGFAMGVVGTATALESADVAVMDDQLNKLVKFIYLSRKTSKILVQNISLALIIKLLFFILAFRGDASLWMAVFADVGASLLVVFNGLRLLK
jgi:Cd2+/Zn2+-exporting ATPase